MQIQMLENPGDVGSTEYVGKTVCNTNTEEDHEYNSDNIFITEHRAFAFWQRAILKK